MTEGSIICVFMYQAVCIRDGLPITDLVQIFGPNLRRNGNFSIAFLIESIISNTCTEIYMRWVHVVNTR